jgi:hypothetical protein
VSNDETSDGVTVVGRRPAAPGAQLPAGGASATDPLDTSPGIDAGVGRGRRALRWRGADRSGRDERDAGVSRGPSASRADPTPAARAGAGTGSTLRTPVVALVFNRPAKTRRVFEAIRQARPARLLVVADGPRGNHPGEAERCAQARAVVENVDWPCEVERCYAEGNLGCRQRVSSGLTWAFERVEEAIVLEDDCLPDPSFFRFCEELLERFREDRRIMMISGDNFLGGRGRTGDSYYFSRYAHVWGWATWRRAWSRYDVEMRRWPAVRDGDWLRDVLGDEALSAFWTEAFERVYRGEIDTWDFQWVLTCWLEGGYAVMPRTNLVANIGFDDEATHTKGHRAVIGLPLQPLEFPLHHPEFVIRDAEADRMTEESMGWGRSVATVTWVRHRLRAALGSALRRVGLRS